jgi:hypothetical protein
MNNLREVKADLLKEWIEYREETIFAIMNAEEEKQDKSPNKNSPERC